MPPGLSETQKRHWKHLTAQAGLNADPLLLDFYLKTLRLHEEAAKDLRTAKMVVDAGREGVKVNPLFRIYSDAAKQLLALRKLLLPAGTPTTPKPSAKDDPMEALIDGQGR